MAAPCCTRHRVRLSDDLNDTAARKVVVEYYLDRPGYNMAHSSARVWDDPPKTCASADIAGFLDAQGIKLLEDSTLLVEVYLDAYNTFMLLDACKDATVIFDFSDVTAAEPGILNIRLTDLLATADEGKREVERGSNSGGTSLCSLSATGLFAFALTNIFQAADLMEKLCPGTVDSSFVLTWGPYAFWASGAVQVLVSMVAVARNNVYGATAFMTFGSLALSNGTKLILQSYFPDQIPDSLLLGTDHAGIFILNFYILAFCCVLFKQTFNMNKISSILIALLISLRLVACFSQWSLALQWVQMVLAMLVSLWAFFAFTCEFTNEVYHYQVFYVYPWNEPKPEEEFGQIFEAAGRSPTLYSCAAKLRMASIVPTTNNHALRMASPNLTTIVEE